MGESGDSKGDSIHNGRSSTTTTAQDRVALISDHLDAKAQPFSSRRRSKKKSADDTLPADYSDILGQIRTLRSIAATPEKNNSGYIRQKAAGKLWVRERVEQLLDPGSFKEVGSVSGTVQWKSLGGVLEEPEKYVPSNNVQGRMLCFAYDDIS